MLLVGCTAAGCWVWSAVYQGWSAVPRGASQQAESSAGDRVTIERWWSTAGWQWTSRVHLTQHPTCCTTVWWRSRRPSLRYVTSAATGQRQTEIERTWIVSRDICKNCLMLLAWNIFFTNTYSAPGRGGRFCDEQLSMSLCICLYAYPNTYPMWELPKINSWSAANPKARGLRGQERGGVLGEEQQAPSPSARGSGSAVSSPTEFGTEPWPPNGFLIFYRCQVAVLALQ